MQYLYAAEISDFEDTKQHYKNLSNSIHSIHDLYLLEISLLIEIFKKAVNNFELASLKLINNSKEKDFDMSVNAFRRLAGTCKGCHQKFRN